MSERIYTRGEQGRLEPLEEEPFSTEDEIQSLIAEHPELLDGEQIRPGDPRRWLLITREKGISETSGSGARWAVDHLIVDQDAVPTLAEVKRGSNPEIRRTIVGQMLEYAAHAAGTWTADELRRTFEESTSAQGHDPGQELGRLLRTDGQPDADGFWENVATNLSARRLTLFTDQVGTAWPRALAPPRGASKVGSNNHIDRLPQGLRCCAFYRAGFPLHAHCLSPSGCRAFS